MSDILKLPTSDEGVDAIELSFEGATLAISITARSILSRIEFPDVLSFRWVAEPAAHCWPSTYDTLVEVELDDWARGVVSSPAGAFIGTTLKQYRIFLSNHGALEVIAGTAQIG